MATRLLPDWIEGYLEYTEETEPARAFHLWTAFYIMAAALRKKVRLSMGRFNIYPNLYVVFVANPGIARKSQAINFGLDFLKDIPDIRLSAESITKEALLVDLELSSVQDQFPDGTLITHSSLNIVSKEFESFLGQKKENTKMLVMLTDLFDAQELPFKYRTKHSGDNVIPSVYLNLIAATTPDSLASSLPSSAIGGGLTSRILFIWAERKRKKKSRPVLTDKEKAMKAKLMSDLFIISRITGEYTFSKDAGEFYDRWYNAYEENEPTRLCKDPSFDGWYSRKPLYCLKTALCVAASRSNDLVLRQEHLEEAIGQIESVERDMGHVFRAIGKSVVVNEVDIAYQVISNHKVISEEDLLRITYRDIDSNKFNNVIQTLTRSGKVRRTFSGPSGETGTSWYWEDKYFKTQTKEIK